MDIMRERKIINRVAMMKSQYGVIGIKTEFEAEGATFNEVVKLYQIASHAGLISATTGIALKIGGPEDVWGIKQARILDARDVVAPMVESKHALKKFLKAYQLYIPDSSRAEMAPAVNIETDQAYRNLDAMLSAGREYGLHGITVGRVDMVESLEWGRGVIDSDEVFTIVEDICRKARHAGFRVTVGGAIEPKSREFLERLILLGILDRFETRKVIFEASLDLVRDAERYTKAVVNAHRVEIDWLESRKEYNHQLSIEDSARLEMLYKRVRQYE